MTSRRPRSPVCSQPSRSISSAVAARRASSRRRRWAPDHDLAVVGDADRDAGDRPADRADADVARADSGSCTARPRSVRSPRRWAARWPWNHRSRPGCTGAAPHDSIRAWSSPSCWRISCRRSGRAAAAGLRSRADAPGGHPPGSRSPRPGSAGRVLGEPRAVPRRAPRMPSRNFSHTRGTAKKSVGRQARRSGPRWPGCGRTTSRPRRPAGRSR